MLKLTGSIHTPEKVLSEFDRRSCDWCVKLLFRLDEVAVVVLYDDDQVLDQMVGCVDCMPAMGAFIVAGRFGEAEGRAA